MNRRNQVLSIVLLAQVALAAVIFISRSAPTSTPGAPLLGTLKASDVIGFTLQDNGGKAITLTQQNGNWIIPSIDNYPALAERVTGMLDKLLAVKTDALETSTTAAHRQLQVADDTFARKLDLQLADGSRQTVYIGAATTGASAHMRVAGKDEVYLARTFAAFDLNADATAWIEPVYVNLAQSDILTATLKNATGTFHFSHDAQNQWTLSDLAASEQINSDAIVTLLARLTNLQMIEPLGRTLKPEYGMDTATALVVDLKTDSGTKTLLLTIGAKNPTDNSYVIISSDSPYYVRTSQFNVEGFTTSNRTSFLTLPPTPVPTVEPTATLEPTVTITATGTTTTTK